MITKSGLMVGLGETREEISALLRDLRAVGVEVITVGQTEVLALTCGLIVEEGFDVAELQRVQESIGQTCREARAPLVTGDTKVVPRGAADQLFINTAGIGVIPAGIQVSAHRASPGDMILINGHIGDHGAAIADARRLLEGEENNK